MNLTRRAAIAATALTLPLPLITRARAGTRKLRMGVTLPADSHIGEPLRYFAQQVATGTAGRVVVDLQWAGAAGNDRGIVNDVAASILDCGHVSISPFETLVPSTALLYTPFLFRDDSHLYGVLDGPIGEAMEAALATHHIHLLGWAENGLRHLTADRAIADASALAGVRVRVAASELMMAAFNAMGAIAGAVAWKQLYQELKAGRFQAAENAISNIVPARLHEVQKFLMLTAHSHSPAAIIASDDVMEDLSASDRTVLLQAGRTAARMTRIASANSAAAGLASLRAQGMTVIEDIDRASFMAALAPALPAIASRYGSAELERIRSHGA